MNKSKIRNKTRESRSGLFLKVQKLKNARLDGIDDQII